MDKKENEMTRNNNPKYEKLILNMVNFYILFEREFSNLIPEIDTKEMTPLLSRMLNEIHMQGRTTSKELGQRLNLSDPNTSRSVRILLELGYIEKNTCVKDKRISYITLSQKGFHLLEEALLLNQAKYFEKLNYLDEKDMDTLLKNFKELQEIFLKMGKVGL